MRNTTCLYCALFNGGSLRIMRSRSSITLHFRAEAYDHPSGYVDAGTVMSWLDKAGYAAAATWAGSNVVATYIGNMKFGHPVPVDTQITAQARLIYTEDTQVHVQGRLTLPEVWMTTGNRPWPRGWSWCIRRSTPRADQNRSSSGNRAPRRGTVVGNWPSSVRLNTPAGKMRLGRCRFRIRPRRRPKSCCCVSLRMRRK